MKKVYLFLSMLLLFGTKTFSQGSDIIFLIDNSGSIAQNEFNDITININNIFNNVITCNPDNRVAVVQYSSQNGAPRIFINSDFTATPFNVTRAYPNGGGNVAGSVDLVADALDGNPNAGITSPITTLNRTPGNALVVYLFSDAVRNNDLVNGDGTTIGTNPPFQSFTNFKNNFGATFIVTLVVANGDNTAAPAAAGIASAGGSYFGPVENYTNDPDFQQVPRYLLIPQDPINRFRLNNAEIEIVTDDICTVAIPPCTFTLTLTTPANDVTGQDNRQVSNLLTASNHFSSGAVGIYHSENTVVLAHDFHAVNGSRFRGYIWACDGSFNGRPAPTSEDEAYESPNAETFNKRLNLSPNPANNSVTITTDKSMLNITVTSLEGRLMYNRDVKGNAHDIDISTYAKGYYTVTITTEDGEVLSEKLIKN